MIMEVMFGKGGKVAETMIKKCIVYYRTDEFEPILSEILDILKPQIEFCEIEGLKNEAKSYGLQKI